MSCELRADAIECYCRVLAVVLGVWVLVFPWHAPVWHIVITHITAYVVL